MNHKLEIDGIRFEDNGRTILSNIFLHCETGKITGLLGRNGQGKSCLLKIIYGSLACEKSVRHNGRSLPYAYNQPDIMRYLPQHNFIPKQLSVKRVCSDLDISFAMLRDRFPEFASKQHTHVGVLSGGERRLLELYVILCSSSQFVLLDEPFTNLDPLHIEKAKSLLHELKTQKGLLITDHLFHHVLDVSDSVYVLKDGQTYLSNHISDIERLGYANEN